jgi:predicted O-methyltransferase YrrM
MAGTQEILDSIPTSWREHAPFARWLVRRILPCTIVDLGVDFGFSTFTFATTGIGFVFGVDAFEGDAHAGARDTEREVRQKLMELELTNCAIVRGRFDEVAASWTTPIDILHIDGYHSFDAAKNDYDTWTRFLKPKGVVLMHDTCVEGHGYEVGKFFNTIDLPKVNFGHCYGLGVVSQDEKLIEEIRSTFKDKLI